MQPFRMTPESEQLDHNIDAVVNQFNQSQNKMSDAELIKQFVKEQLDEEINHISPQGKPSLRPPSSTFDAMEAGVQY